MQPQRAQPDRTDCKVEIPARTIFIPRGPDERAGEISAVINNIRERRHGEHDSVLALVAGEMLKHTPTEQATIGDLQNNWIWVPGWVDQPDSNVNTAGRLVTFRRVLDLTAVPSHSVIHITADTRYKLEINGKRVCVGPSRSTAQQWFYDSIDIAPHLVAGHNEVVVRVMRYFLESRAGMPFVRTPSPGLTVAGEIGEASISTGEGWEARIEHHIEFPTGLIDDVFLHINERTSSRTTQAWVTPQRYTIKTVNGELAPWRLTPRRIPLPVQTTIRNVAVQIPSGGIEQSSWQSVLDSHKPITLPPHSATQFDLVAPSHSTAFIRWKLSAQQPTKVKLKMTYSEGYELEPRLYPWLRNKEDRLDAVHGQLLGPCDEVTLALEPGDNYYEPFWFRTFRLVRVGIEALGTGVKVEQVDFTQTNYPMDTKAAWSNPADRDSRKVWELCVRTMRNCMFDGYSDCPFYEQLQYAGDTRSVAIFHYLLSGDDRLMRQAIIHFACSMTPEGLTQSRHPSHVPQIVVGFSLYWIMSICDHMTYFNDVAFVRPLLPLIDRVFEYYHAHVDELGLISGFPVDVWQYVDWVDGWHATDDHPDKGVPTAGRASNRHTYFSMLYVWTLRQAAQLLRDVERFGLVQEYEDRADAVVDAMREHCHDGRFFTDSTSDVDVSDVPTPYSQHCQVFAVLSGVCTDADAESLLTRSFAPNHGLGKCSYVMMFYAFRAFSKVGSDFYQKMYFEDRTFEPWRRMLKNNLSTLEEDDVRQRSDCHAWGATPVFEYCSEVAGLKPLAPGWEVIEWAPKVALCGMGMDVKVALGKSNVGGVTCRMDGSNGRVLRLRLERAVKVVTRSAAGTQDHGVVREVSIAA